MDWWSGRRQKSDRLCMGQYIRKMVCRLERQNGSGVCWGHLTIVYVHASPWEPVVNRRFRFFVPMRQLLVTVPVLRCATTTMRYYDNCNQLDVDEGLDVIDHRLETRCKRNIFVFNCSWSSLEAFIGLGRRRPTAETRNFLTTAVVFDWHYNASDVCYDLRKWW